MAAVQNLIQLHICFINLNQEVELNSVGIRADNAMKDIGSNIQMSFGFQTRHEQVDEGQCTDFIAYISPSSKQAVLSDVAILQNNWPQYIVYAYGIDVLFGG